MALVAEIAASAIIGQLVDVVINYAGSSWWPSARSIKEDAEKLQAALPQIRAVLAAVQVDRIKQTNPDLEARLWQFRDAIETAEDVLDEIEYYELEEKIKARDNKVSGPLSGSKRKVVDFVKNAINNKGVMNKLREAVKGLEAMASDAGPFLQLANSLNEQLVVSNFRETGSILTESRVVGRETEKEMIVEWLTSNIGFDEQLRLSCFAIFGMGGMGKTTLTQLVCEDQRVIDNFELIVWVCVSDDSGIVHAKIIIKRMLEEITKQNCNLDNLSTLQRTLKENVASKKFLLVLDDVWRDDKLSEWEKIVAPLRLGQRGSKILLTTRMESVAKMIGRAIGEENKYLNLAGLNENDFMTLFYQHAFDGDDFNKYKYLHEIGHKIAQNLRACPLAAKVIGGVLNSQINFEFWNKISNDDVINIRTNTDHNIMDILKLSYYHLPAHLQICFRYCSIFEQDHRFSKVELVQHWMCSGLISGYASGQTRPEDVADVYLDQLRRKSFLNMELNDESENVYFIHDLLHDLARCVSEGECLRITDPSSVAIPRTLRHLVISTHKLYMLEEIRNLNKLRTLIIFFINYDREIEQELNGILLEFKSLRVLRMKTSTTANRIGDLIHLRYLDIYFQGTSAEQYICFVKPLCRLYHLVVMNIDEFRTWQNQENEIKDVCNLINLQYFRVESGIPWLGKLSALKELKFCIEDNFGYKIGELRNLNELQRLSVYNLNCISNPDDVLEAKMDIKKNLKFLELHWSGYNSYDFSVSGSERDAEVADNLKPTSNLNELRIESYSGNRSPCWMSDCSYCNLTRVTLSFCNKWEVLPPLGHLSSLKYLKLKLMNAVKQVGHSLYGENGNCIFPSLIELEFNHMWEWEEWIGVDDKLLFPRLEKLSIRNCHKLKRLPTLPSTLRCLTICNTALETLPEFYQAPGDIIGGASYVPLRSSLTKLIIEGCANIITLNGWEFLQQPQNLHSLKEIFLTNCKNLLDMPNDLALLPSLVRLHFNNCPKLVSSVRLPATLRELNFGSIGDAEPSVIRSLQELTSLTHLRMHCASMQSLPPVEVFARLTNLCNLSIEICNNLASLRGIEGLPGLKYLRILRCKKFTELSRQQPSLLDDNNQVISLSNNFGLDELDIDCTSLLLMEPLRSLRTTQSLTIKYDKQSTSLPEQWLMQNRLSLKELNLEWLSSLQSLPPSMESMCSLQCLSIYFSELLRSLPNLPSSLISLKISACHPELEKLYRRKTGLYWPMISYIPDVHIKYRS